MKPPPSLTEIGAVYVVILLPLLSVLFRRSSIRQTIFFITLIFLFDDQIALPISISTRHLCTYCSKYKVFIYNVIYKSLLERLHIDY